MNSTTQHATNNVANDTIVMALSQTDELIRQFPSLQPVSWQGTLGDVEFTAPVEGPDCRAIYRIAVFCGLKKEFEMVCAVLDELPSQGHISKRYQQERPGDQYTYIFGKLASHNVVIVLLPRTGGLEAAIAAENTRSNFPNIEFAFVVGVCGTVPTHPETEEEIILGDCIISTQVFGYGYGRHYPAGIRSYPSHETAYKLSRMILSKLSTLDMPAERSIMARRLREHLNILRQRLEYWRGDVQDLPPAEYPGRVMDQLYEVDYVHTHKDLTQDCRHCDLNAGICKQDCVALNCDNTRLIQRRRLMQDPSNSTQEPMPRVHYGHFGSAEFVMKSGTHRNDFAEELKLVGFDMEGAGIASAFAPFTIVVKSACDYADSHKNKRFQEYAAATAAAGLRALLEEFKPYHLETALQEWRTATPRFTMLLPGSIMTVNKDAIWLVPFDMSEDFIGREELLDQLLNTLILQQDRICSRRAALVGMPGVGKSQIAVQFAYRLRQNYAYRSVFWIHVSDSQQFEQGYLDIAQKANIEIPEGSDPLTIVLGWLSDPANGAWTMILDSADNTDVFTSVNQHGRRLLDFIPREPHGSILITTRSRRTAVNLILGRGARFEVGVMAEDEALKLLVARAEITNDDEAAAILVRKLGHLPLAITQAAAYIRVRKMTMNIREYIAMIQDERERVYLLAANDTLHHSRDGTTQDNVLAVMQTTFRLVQEQNPKAADLLALICMFNIRNIPREILRNQNDRNRHEFDDSIELLYDLCLIGSEQGSNSLYTHQMVQTAMVDWLDNDGKLKTFQSDAIHAIAVAFPVAHHQTWRKCRRLLAHAMRVTDYEIRDDAQAERISLMERIAHYLQSTGHIQEAEMLCHKACLLSHEVLGETHRATLRLHNIRCTILRDRGQYKEANQTLQHIAKVYRDLNIVNADSLVAESNLASTHLKLGEHGKAEVVESRVLDLRCRILGATSRDTLASKARLALIIAARGDRTTALSECEAVLQERKRYLPKNDPDTLASMSDLARILRSAGQYREAKALFEKALAIKKSVLGDEHPNTLTNMSNLATTLLKLNWIDENKEAEKLIRSVLTTRMRILPKDDHRILSSRHDLGQVLAQQKKNREAEEEFKIAMYGRVRILGLDHPETKSSMQALYEALTAQHRYAEAEKLRFNFERRLSNRQTNPRFFIQSWDTQSISTTDQEEWHSTREQASTIHSQGWHSTHTSFSPLVSREWHTPIGSSIASSRHLETVDE